MAKSLATNAVIDFVAEVHHQFQAREKLAGTTRERMNIVGDSCKFPVLGKGTARARTAPQVKLELMNAPHSRVTCSLSDYNASEMTDIWDQAEVNYDERRELAQVIAGGLGRRKDQIVIDALIAAKTAATITKSVAATGFGGENTLNIERVLEARRLLAVDEIDDDLYFCCHATDVAQALETVEFASADYNTLRALNSGTLDDVSFHGFKWKVLGDRSDEGGLALASTTRQCWAWAKNAVGRASGKMQDADISWLGDYGSWITSGFLKMGACVIDPLGCVEVLCNEA